jgi:hypothetical protein
LIEGSRVKVRLRGEFSSKFMFPILLLVMDLFGVVVGFLDEKSLLEKGLLIMLFKSY